MFPVARLTDKELLAEVKQLATRERQVTARLIASLVELDTRRLYLGEGCSSLFTYCTQVLHLSEHAAYGRIEAARAARRFPIIIEQLEAGAVNLTTVSLVAPHLTPENHRDVLDAARHKSKREVEHLVASLRPLPAVPSSVRKFPEAKPVEVSRPGLSDATFDDAPAPSPRPLPVRPSVVAPLAPGRYRVQFTVTRGTYEKLRRAQDLLRHTIPSGDPAAIFDRALTLLIAEAEKTKLAATTRPRPARPSVRESRHIPAAVKRAVWARDGGQSAFIGAEGRCTERGFLEFHHVVPYADGGQVVTDNLQLRCRAHNAYEAEVHFGPLLVREDPGPAYGRTRSGPSWRQDARAGSPLLWVQRRYPGETTRLALRRTPRRAPAAIDGRVDRIRSHFGVYRKGWSPSSTEPHVCTERPTSGVPGHNSAK